MNNYQRLVDEYIRFEEETLEKDSREIYSMAGDDYIVGSFEDTQNFIRTYIKSLEDN